MEKIIDLFKDFSSFLIVLTGSFLLFLQLIIHVPHIGDEGILEIVFSFVPVIFSIIIIFTGFFLRRIFSKKNNLIVFAASLSILGISILVTSVNLFYVVLRGGSLFEPMSFLVNNGSAGAFVGLVIGYYYVLSLREKERVKLLQSTMTHDLKNKAQIILGELDLLKKEVNQESYERVSRAKEIMYDLIDLSDKIRMYQRQSYKPSKININDLKKKTKEVIGEMDGIEVFFKDEMQENVEIKAGDLIKEVIKEVINNAKTHGEASKVFITLKEKPKRILLSIEDDGRGMESKEQKMVFQKEYTTTNASYGMGLYLVKEIIENFEGSIEINESEHGGTKVDIFLKKEI